MPVVKLYCEGNAGSPDVRVLSRLLSVGTTITILPDNSKSGMDGRIQIRRETIPGAYGIVDRDFAISWQLPTEKPCLWEKNGQILGWTWERKEIENYLLDPIVVQNALGAKKTPRNYPDLLETAADLIARYQAARLALVSCQPAKIRLDSKFGKPRGKHGYPFPELFDDATCQSELTQKVQGYLNQVSSVIDNTMVIQTYQNLLPECLADGVRRQNFLYAFAGKDLLWALHDPLMLVGVGGGSPTFLEKILVGIRNTGDDIATWLPEWQALRDMIREI